MSSGGNQLSRQSFKDLGQAKVQTVVKDQQKIMKRCATGKTLSIQEINAQSGYIQNNDGSSTSTLCNPTFISTNSAVIPNPRMHHNATQQQLLAQ